MKSFRWLCGALALGLTLTGCGIVSVTKPGESTDELTGKLSALKDSGQSAPLNSVTDFSWDTVHLFPEYTPRERIEQVVGRPVIEGNEVSSGGLLIFEDGGEIVKTVHVRGDYLRADHPTWDAAVELQPWGGGFLRLTD